MCSHQETIKETAFLLVMVLQLSSSFTPLKMQDPELVNQLKERLPEALFEKLNGSLSIDRDRLRFAEYKVRVLEERLRLVACGSP